MINFYRNFFGEEIEIQTFFLAPIFYSAIYMLVTVPSSLIGSVANMQ